MEKEQFKAVAQYDDWKGSVAADGADQNDFSEFLRAKGILKQGEIVKGISFYSAEHFFDVEAYVTDDQHGLRKERVEMTLEDFLKHSNVSQSKFLAKGNLTIKKLSLKDRGTPNEFLLQ